MYATRQQPDATVHAELVVSRAGRGCQKVTEQARRGLGEAERVRPRTRATREEGCFPPSELEFVVPSE